MNAQPLHTQSYYRLDRVGDDVCDLSRRLLVNCCGVSVIDTPFRSLHPTGRKDFYLMCLTQGELEIRSDENRFRLTPGCVVIHRPGRPYGYRLTKAGRMVYRWVHFTGSQAGSLLMDLGLTLGEALHIGDAEGLEDDFEALQRLFITRPPLYLEESAVRLELLLTHLSRAVFTAADGRRERLQASLDYLNRHYAEPIRLEALSAMEFLSVSRYSALFRKITGVSPQQYLIALRLKNAKGFLLSTDLSVSEIARNVGYDDALYFSRLFHRHFGVAPSTFRTKR